MDLKTLCMLPVMVLPLVVEGRAGNRWGTPARVWLPLCLDPSTGKQ